MEYERESCIRGHHIYYPVWTSYVGEQLVCIQEPLNSVDRFAVAVKKDDSVVGLADRYKHLLLNLDWLEVFIQRHDTCRHRNFRTIEIFGK